MSSDNAHFAITYTSISSYSDGPSWGIPLMNAGELPEMDLYEEIAQQGQVPPLLPAYVHDPIELDEHVQVYILEPKHPEYHAPSDDDIQVKDQPYDDDASSTVEPPGYIADSDSMEKDLKEDPSAEHEPEDDDEDPEEEPNEKHEPEDKDTKEDEPSKGSDETKPFEENKTSGTPPPPRHHGARISAPLGHRTTMICIRDDIPEEDMPLRRRFVLTAPLPGCDVAESSVVAATRVPRGQYDFVDTVVVGQSLVCSPGHDARTIARSADRAEDVGYVRALHASEHRMMTSIEEVNLRINYQAQVRKKESKYFYTQLHDAQTDCRDIRLEIDVMRGQRTAYETELQECQSTEDLTVTQMMRIHALEARARTDTVEDGTLKKKFTDKYCLKGEIKKLEIELWNLRVKGNDVAAYTQRFQKLALMCTKFLANETEKVLPDNIHGNVMSTRPKTLDDAIELANDLMDQKLRTYAKRQNDNKRKADDSLRNNQQPYKKQNVARSYTVGPGEKKAYTGNLPMFTKRNYHHTERCAPKCEKCKRSTKNGNGNGVAQRRAYALGGRDASPDSNVITGVNTIIRGCTLNFMNHPFNIDLMHVPLGSFDVIIGMDWLTKYHGVIICDEKIVRVPFGREMLIFQGNGNNQREESRLNFISCTKAQEYLSNGCDVFLAHITTKEAKDKSEGKSIADNILLTQELMHNYHLDHGVARCAFKVDIQKAYDTVDWVFLKNILAGFGFHDRMIGWIMECVMTTSFFISINGSLHGFFKGKRGLRQGDPLSPYFLRLLWKFLLSCSNVVDTDSVKVIKGALNEFQEASGLVPSILKSKGYFCNVLNFTKIAILQILPFEEGYLPVKYLGVPLITSRLVFRDCRELIEKVNIRVDDWKNKFLSAAGRLQLIRSVLSSMHIYWASMFILPFRVLINIERIIRRFLWKGGSKVAWEAVCLPKDEGGLGVRRLDTFNKALMVSHIWKLLSLKESLWVKWVHIYKLKGRNFLDIPIRSRLSWGWRKVLQIRPLIREYIWEVFHDGIWSWPMELCSKYLQLHNIQCRCSNPNNDRLEWRDEGGMVKPFLVSMVWATIRHRNPKADWYAVVWFPYCIPRHAFNLWLIINRKLKTQDKVASWEVSDLLMTQVWHYMKSFAALPNSNEVFQQILLEVISFSKRKSPKSVIAKLVLAASAYFIWQERNWRMFKNNKRTVQQVRECIYSTVRLKLLSCRFKKTRSGVSLAQRWNLPDSCFINNVNA
uniref:Reverse transcriptase domain-containing protein n=1 Tax=Tanacetum cinerariifolium TaxID=118510 RepID=A0A6L2MI41_TANCI|nr:hypothetical protein [Tanacetum cinerariifolium]